jgi:hypothetical protein
MGGRESVQSTSPSDHESLWIRKKWVSRETICLPRRSPSLQPRYSTAQAHFRSVSFHYPQCCSIYWLQKKRRFPASRKKLDGAKVVINGSWPSSFHLDCQNRVLNTIFSSACYPWHTMPHTKMGDSEPHFYSSEVQRTLRIVYRADLWSINAPKRKRLARNICVLKIISWNYLRMINEFCYQIPLWPNMSCYLYDRGRMFLTKHWVPIMEISPLPFSSLRNFKITFPEDIGLG